MLQPAEVAVRELGDAEPEPGRAESTGVEESAGPISIGCFPSRLSYSTGRLQMVRFRLTRTYVSSSTVSLMVLSDIATTLFALAASSEAH